MASVRGSASIGTPNAPLAATLWQAPTPRAERVGALGCSITRTVGASTDRGSVGDASRICGGFLSSAWNTDPAGSEGPPAASARARIRYKSPPLTTDLWFHLHT